MLLYRFPGSSITTFHNTLENLPSDHHTIDLVLSDFNIDILNSTNINLPNVLSDYTLLVNEATHSSGSLLYHAYVNAVEVLG